MKNRKKLLSNLVRYLILLSGGAVSVMPMIYMLSTSLRPNGALYEFPPRFFVSPDEITFENYQYIVQQEKFYLNIDRVGNTSSASVPIALDELNRAGRLQRGDKIILTAFGGGLANAACLLTW